jgi:hypothetical protein
MCKELEEKLARRRARSPIKASDHPGVERLPSTLEVRPGTCVFQPKVPVT